MNTQKNFTLLIGCYNSDNCEKTGIWKISIDKKSGRMDSPIAAAEVINPAWLSAITEKDLILALEESHNKPEISLSVFQLTENGNLNHKDKISLQGSDACHLSVRENLAVCSNYSGETIDIVDLNTLSQVDSKRFTGTGPVSDRQEKAHPHCTVFSPGGGYILTADLGSDCVHICGIQTDSTVTISRKVSVKAGSGPRHILFSLCGSYLYLVNELDSTLTVFLWDEKTADLTFIRSVSTRLKTLKSENYPAALRISKDNNRLYVSNRGDNNIVVFDISDKKMPRLTDSVDSGGIWPRNFLLTEDERFLITSNQYSGEICIFYMNDRKIPVQKVSSVKLKNPSGMVII